MIEAYLNLADRIHKELNVITGVINRAQRAVVAARKHPEDQDLYMDSAALNLHDFYGGLERIFQQIGTTIDGNIPTGSDWHREILHQMQRDVPDLRPPVLSTEVVNSLDEFRRFRHVVRNIYAFEFDPDRISRLVHQMSDSFTHIRTELMVFASFLEQVGE